ncbi:MAG: class I SAM-dependent methyltransferase [Phenylobacterium sp.]|uniref:class I SAM-dependent methyltransferase n=1 Tax=Phenylobacterium sp. TaxID=1871053 RepID=UPI002726BF9B|nr:class I SAM-dependent methyltransferase [Phenylobacterium sp.]MDO8911791.1 class I SAM-dependent methyltransferase [Phenylobacterium sp.]MDP3099952.1 class I SAM-dependent methyltransferase [Phenylobacterium sp.]
MSSASDARFWDRISRKYARDAIADLGGYERTLDRTRALLNPDDQVLELGCGTGSTALRLAGDVRRYLATDLSAGMIVIAREKQAASPIPALAFQVATAEATTLEAGRFDAVLGFNYLHMVRDVPGTLRRIHTLLAPSGLFISKTPCLGDMNPLLSGVLLPAMRAIGRAPYVSVFWQTELCDLVSSAGFDILAAENHATKGDDRRPCIVARKRSEAPAAP